MFPAEALDDRQVKVVGSCPICKGTFFQFINVDTDPALNLSKIADGKTWQAMGFPGLLPTDKALEGFTW